MNSSNGHTDAQNAGRRRLFLRPNAAVLTAAAAAVLALAIVLTVALALHSCNAVDYYILDEKDIAVQTSKNEYASEEQRVFVESALSLVGKVSYFWGGKCYTLGPDPAWGEPRKVTSDGHSTSGTVQPYGLDCSGYVSWCYIQLGRSKEEMVEDIGNGTWNQWDKSAAVKKRDVRLGDLAFINEYPNAGGNHVGICVGFLDGGEPLIAHCSNTQNNVVVSTCGREFIYFRRPAFLSENHEEEREAQ